ncbi:acetyltransferase [Candidatus Nitrotoga arctica]|uniref:PglD_N domain-containing protein n=1 Tax=Candidatus Nitrotoga arctica TaxID=453162 RepID=A0ABM8YW86_9PROT|nr:acetyltransferase [Candidatus Nitrotoga arctica]CAG9931747.1 PglD_N domain-containing protein [Candidatus Nitrotoga arctica]
MKSGINLDNIIIFGTGGHAKTVIGVLECEGKWRLSGLVVDDCNLPDEKRVLGYEILGNRSAFSILQGRGIVKGFVAVGDNIVRAEIAVSMRKSGFSLVSIMHPSACVMKDAIVGEGTFIHAFSIIGAECSVGFNAIIQPQTSVGHESFIGDYVQFSPGVHIGGKVRIGDGSFFGPGAVVFPSVTIGQNVSVGANTVVNKDVPDNAVIVGNPGRMVKLK